MKQTMAEKLLARASGQSTVRAGDIVDVELDRIMVHEGIAWGVAEAIDQLGVERLANPDRIVALLDHFAPPPDEAAAKLHMACRQFVERFGLNHFYDMRKGICHQVLVEEWVNPGDVIVGSDSHTTTYGALGAFAAGFGFTDVALAMATGRTWFKVPETVRFDLQGRMPEGVYSRDIILDLLGRLRTDGATYRSCEFGGDGLGTLSVAERLTISNGCAEMGAKVALMPVDEVAGEFLARAGRPARPEAVVEADPDAVYFRRVPVDLESLTPRVAQPHSPDNVCAVEEAEPVAVDQVFIGGCANGRIEDLRVAAAILKGRQLAPRVRLLVVPASYRVMKEMSAEGLLDVFIDAGAVIGASTCGPCFGGHFGLLGPGEVCISTATRNFVGRMGSKQARIYLASPATAAAAAVTGCLTDPRHLM